MSGARSNVCFRGRSRYQWRASETAQTLLLLLKTPRKLATCGSRVLIYALATQTR